MAERRRSERLETNWRLYIGIGDKHILGRVINASASGLRFNCAAHLRAGDTISVDVVPALPGFFRCNATIVYVSEDGASRDGEHSYGAKFQDVSALDGEILASSLTKLQQKAA